MQMSEKLGRPIDHIWTMLIHQVLHSVRTYSTIIILGLKLFSYMKVDCLCFDLVYEWPLEHHSGWNALLN